MQSPPPLLFAVLIPFLQLARGGLSYPQAREKVKLQTKLRAVVGRAQQRLTYQATAPTKGGQTNSGKARPGENANAVRRDTITGTSDEFSSSDAGYVAEEEQAADVEGGIPHKDVYSAAHSMERANSRGGAAGGIEMGSSPLSTVSSAYRGQRPAIAREAVNTAVIGTGSELELGTCKGGNVQDHADCIRFQRQRLLEGGLVVEGAEELESIRLLPKYALPKPAGVLVGASVPEASRRGSTVAGTGGEPPAGREKQGVGAAAAAVAGGRNGVGGMLEASTAGMEGEHGAGSRGKRIHEAEDEVSAAACERVSSTSRPMSVCEHAAAPAGGSGSPEADIDEGQGGNAGVCHTHPVLMRTSCACLLYVFDLKKTMDLCSVCPQLHSNLWKLLQEGQIEV